MRAHSLLTLSVALLACGSVVGEDNAATAERTAERAKEGMHRGVEAVRTQVGRIDWKRAGTEIWTQLKHAPAAVGEALESDDDTDPFADADQAIRCEDLTCTVTADFAGRMRAHPARMAEQARVRPHEEGGTTIGLRVDRIATDSLPHRFGFRDRDVVLSVNHIALDSLSGSFTLALQLRSASHFEVEFLRDGEERTLVVDVE